MPALTSLWFDAATFHSLLSDRNIADYPYGRPTVSKLGDDLHGCAAGVLLSVTPVNTGDHRLKRPGNKNSVRRKAALCQKQTSEARIELKTTNGGATLLYRFDQK
jgi:hypothetical protein